MDASVEQSESSKDLELLERVFLRFALAETDDQLEQAVNNFLVAVLIKLKTPNSDVKNKILELLTHISKRLKSRSRIKLPLKQLIDLYQDDKCISSIYNFAIIYIKMGFQRAELDEKLLLVPRLLSCLKGKPKPHQIILLQNALYCLNDFKYPENIEQRKQQFNFTGDKLVNTLVLNHLSDFLLLPYNLDVDMNVFMLPSLSKSAFLQVKGEASLSSDVIEKIKLGILKFLSSEVFVTEDVVVLFVVGSSDTKSSVADTAEHSLKKFTSATTWEDTTVVSKLLQLYQGSSPTKTSQSESADEKRNPSNLRLKLKVFPYFLKSKLLANFNPAISLQIIFGGLFGPEENTSAKLKTYCLEFIHHILHYCSKETMNFLGPLFYQAATRVSLNDKENSKNRCLGLGVFAKMAKRSPHLFKKDIGLLQKLFDLLIVEDGDVRIAVQECVSSIATAYTDLDGMKTKMLETIILSNIDKDMHQLRLAAVQLANKAFPSSHALTRYACIMCVADSKDDVKEEAMNGLQIKKKKIEDSSKLYPPYGDMTALVFEKVFKNKEKVQSTPFPTSVLEVMLKYLFECLHSQCDVKDEDLNDNQYISKISNFFKNILLDTTDISKTVVGYHISIIQSCLQPNSDYSLVAIILKHLLVLICVDVSQISVFFQSYDDILEKYVISTKEEIREYAARLFGVIVSNRSESLMFKKLKSLLDGIKTTKSIEEVHGGMLTYGFILSNYAQRSHEICLTDMEVDSGEENFDFYVSKFAEIAAEKLKSSNVMVIQSACSSLGEVGKVHEFTDDTTPSLKSCIDTLCSIVSDAPEAKSKEKAAIALGYISVSNRTRFYKEITDALFDSAKVKQLELQFTIGESLSCVAAGQLSDISKDKWILPLVQNPQNTSSDDLLSPIIDRILKECIRSPASYNRQAGVTWLLCLLKYAAKHAAIEKHIDVIQAAFVSLLSDGDEITQDIASRGLGLVYHQVGEKKKEVLVSALVDQLMTGKRTKHTFEQDTEVFKPGMLGASPDGGNLSTYKELCSLATSMNQPDLMYKFMNLANHNAIWNSKKGAAFGFLSIASMTSDQLKPYLPQLIPKLYRYQYDTNPGVQQAMSNIWSAIVPDGKKTVDKYTKEILKDLLSNITSNLWRVRESCCLALNDLIKSCSLEDLIEQLPNLWTITFRVMDDIKESVRKSSMLLVKTLSKISIRLCDMNQSNLGDRAIQEILPVLLNVGLSSQVQEVKAISLDTLVKVTKNAGSLLKPHIPKFVQALLESLSGLEPQQLNTLSLQLSHSEEAQEKLDAIRVSASKTSPMMEALNFCVPYVDEQILPTLVPALTDILKTGLGLGTKVGCTTFVVSLTLQCKNMLSPFAGKLLGALLNGMSDRNNSIKKAYAAAIGHLTRYAKESSIEKLITKISNWYLEKEDENIHLSCALCMNYMMLYSPDTSYHYHNMMLPLVFIAKHKQNKDNPQQPQSQSLDTLSKLWIEIWDNSTSGESAAIKLYLNEIITMTTPLLTSQFWGLRIKAANALITVFSKLGESLEEKYISGLIDELSKALHGRTWDGKEYLLEALSELIVKCRPSKEKVAENYINQVIELLLRECKKENMKYKLKALDYTTAVIQVWRLDMFNEMKPIIEKLFAKNDDDDDDDEERNISLKKEMEKIATGYLTLGRVWPFDSCSQDSDFAFACNFYVNKLCGSTWKNQIGILKSILEFIEKTCWKDALTTWSNKSLAHNLVRSLLPELCTCIEKSTYNSVKLNGVKTIKTFYKLAKDCQELLLVINDNTERVEGLAKELSNSTNYDITNNINELTTILASIKNKSTN